MNQNDITQSNMDDARKLGSSAFQALAGSMQALINDLPEGVERIGEVGWPIETEDGHSVTFTAFVLRSEDSVLLLGSMMDFPFDSAGKYAEAILEAVEHNKQANSGNQDNE